MNNHVANNNNMPSKCGIQLHTVHYLTTAGDFFNTKYDPLKCTSLHYQQCVDNMALTSAEDGSFAGILAVLPQGLGPHRGLRLLQLGRTQGLGKERPGAEPSLETGH